MDPASMSFEAKIGLALKGSDWQQMQNLTLGPVTQEQEPVQGGVAIEPDSADGETETPREISAKQKKKMARFEQAIGRDTGEVLQTIEVNSVSPIPQNVTWDQDPEIVCCYNWQASTDGTNTIYVPGEPPKWRQPTLPHTLDADSGFQYTDYNYVRQPRDPYAPMFHALGVMNPDYQFNDVDVLADRNNLRVLLEFVQGKVNGPFRLDLYLNYKTLVIVRKESRWWKHSDGSGYGGNFERFFTRPGEGMDDATSHYRAIRYPMGPLSVVVRFEADAYDDGIAPDTQPGTTAISGGPPQIPTLTYRAPIRVLPKGHIVPTSQMVELKTKKHDPERNSPVACQDQLWFGRTAILLTGRYESKTGVINFVKREDATNRVRNWEDNNQQNLRKLVALLMDLRAVMKRTRSRAVVIAREDKDGPLRVRAMEGVHHAIGREFFAKHWSAGAMQQGQQAGVYRGQRGGGRGGSVGYQGRGQGNARGGGSHSQPDHGRRQPSAAQENQPYGIYRGRGRGRGQSYPPQDRGGFNAPQGRGQFNPSQEGRLFDPYSGRAQGNPLLGRGQSIPFHGRGQHNPTRGRGYTERRGNPDA